jgi:hypothetical protein
MAPAAMGKSVPASVEVFMRSSLVLIVFLLLSVNEIRAQVPGVRPSARQAFEAGRLAERAAASESTMDGILVSVDGSKRTLTVRLRNGTADTDLKYPAKVPFQVDGEAEDVALIAKLEKGTPVRVPVQPGTKTATQILVYLDTNPPWRKGARAPLGDDAKAERKGRSERFHAARKELAKEKADAKRARREADAERDQQARQAAGQDAEKRRVPPEEAATAMLRYAKTLLENGKKETGNYRLGQIVKEYPGTKAAEEAKRLLDGQ